MIYPKSKFLLRIDPMFHSIQIRDKWSGLWETANSFDLRLLLLRNTTLSAGARYSNEIYPRPEVPDERPQALRGHAVHQADRLPGCP